jgi:ankyrin repeat protein
MYRKKLLLVFTIMNVVSFNIMQACADNTLSNAHEREVQQNQLDFALIEAAGTILDNNPKERYDIINKLLDKGANPKYKHWLYGTALIRAVEVNHLVYFNEDNIQLLVERGSDINQWATMYEQTALHTACEHGQLDVAKRLIQAKASLTTTDYKSRTPLKLAKESRLTTADKKQPLIDYLRELEKTEEGRAIEADVITPDHNEQKSSIKNLKKKKHRKKKK